MNGEWKSGHRVKVKKKKKLNALTSRKSLSFREPYISNTKHKNCFVGFVGNYEQQSLSNFI